MTNPATETKSMGRPADALCRQLILRAGPLMASVGNTVLT